ncbi:TonB C-terminal domain-containing protein [Rhodoferax sp. GW822-FHT02A01]|uniref:TonB C-terminal domain-containing protein n=1 Tax=Rhodoferax sp. GW822-FHT02A01 TaxID=3141537 RepID=UPI00315D479F
MNTPVVRSIPAPKHEYKPVSIALLVSLLFHVLVLSLTFYGDGLGLPGFEFPWRERRLHADDLHLVLVPLQSVEKTESTAGGAVQAEAQPETKVLEVVGAKALAPTEPVVTLTTPPVNLPSEEIRPVQPAPVLLAERANPAAIAVVPPAPPSPPVAAPNIPTPEPAKPVMPDANTALPKQPDPPAGERIMEAVKSARTDQETPPPPDPLEIARKMAEQQDAARALAARQEADRQEAASKLVAQQEAARQEAARKEAEQQDALRRAAAQQEAARQDAERAQAERVEAARKETARLEAQRAEAAQQAAARQEAARKDAERLEAARVAAAQQDAVRQELERAEAARKEAARLDAARQEADRMDAVRKEAAQLAARQEAADQEKARQLALRAEQDAKRLDARRKMGQQLNEEAAQRDAAAQAARNSPLLPLSISTARRGRLFGRSDPNAELIRYAEAWSRKIELNMTFDMVREAAKQPHTNPLVTVALRSDGSVESITFVMSSGVPALDEAIRQVVQSQAPYSQFPQGLSRDYDVIEIRRTWNVDMAIRLY